MERVALLCLFHFGGLGGIVIRTFLFHFWSNVIVNHIVDVIADVIVDDSHFIPSFLLILTFVWLFVVVIVWCAE